MSEAPSLGDFFKSKAKKKIKATNLNTAKDATAKPEEKKKAKNAEDEGWEEEQVNAHTMKVEMAGTITKEEEKKDEEDEKPVWGAKSKEVSLINPSLNEKRFPSLAKAVQSSSINIDDGSDAKVNIQTSKNHFAALEGDENSDDEGGPRRPKVINSAGVSKKKGERETAAVKREVEKYTGKSGKKDGDDDDDDDDDDEAEEEVETKKKPEKKPEKKEKEKAKKVEKEEAGPATPQEEAGEDTKIQPDFKASAKKYEKRRKLPVKDIPKEELQEKTAAKAKQQAGGGGKKKRFVVEEETEKKLEYADW